MSLGILPEGLKRLYVDLHKTDVQIADFFDVDRSYISQLRKRHNINSKKSIGEIGEEIVINELRKRGFNVKNMNEFDKKYPFDILVNDFLRVEVKCSKASDDNCFSFSLSEKKENKNIESENRIRLKCGRTRKLYRKTCDIMILVGIDEQNNNHFYLLDPNELKDELSIIRTSLSKFSRSKYKKYRENWHLLKEKSLVAANN